METFLYYIVQAETTLLSEEINCNNGRTELGDVPKIFIIGTFRTRKEAEICLEKNEIKGNTSISFSIVEKEIKFDSADSAPDNRADEMFDLQTRKINSYEEEKRNNIKIGKKRIKRFKKQCAFIKLLLGTDCKSYALKEEIVRKILEIDLRINGENYIYIDENKTLQTILQSYEDWIAEEKGKIFPYPDKITWCNNNCYSNYCFKDTYWEREKERNKKKRT